MSGPADRSDIHRSRLGAVPGRAILLRKEAMSSPKVHLHKASVIGFWYVCMVDVGEVMGWRPTHRWAKRAGLRRGARLVRQRG